MEPNALTSDAKDGTPPAPELRDVTGKTRALTPAEARAYAAAVERRERAATTDDAAPKDDDAPNDEPQGDDAPAADDDEQQPAVAKVELTVPDVTPQEHVARVEGYVQDISVLAGTAGLSREELQGLVDQVVDLATTEQSGVSLDNREACMGVLRSRFGDAADGIVKDAQAAVQRLGKPIADWLDSSGLGNDSSVLFALAEFHRGGTRIAPEKAQAEIDKVLHDKSHPYWKGDKAAQAKMLLLYQRAAGVKSKPETKATTKTSAQSRNEDLDRQIKEATRHPSYSNPSAPDHKAHKAKVAALYSSRWPGNEPEA